MDEKPRFIVVEDKDEDRREVLKLLGRGGFEREQNLGQATTYEEAKRLLESQCRDISVVFLDLNIPRDPSDARPEKDHGKAVLDLIHEDLNRRAQVDIRVIVVSGEDIIDGMGATMLEQLYEGTLVGVARKAFLPKMLKAKIKLLKKDPLRNRIRRLDIDILRQYDSVIDTAPPIKERLKDAKSLAIRLLMNERDYHEGRLGASDARADDLRGLIGDLEHRFTPNRDNKRFVKASAIETSGGWGAFLWRGTMVQHLYTLNSYRNLYEHIDQQPFRNATTNPDEWNIPAGVLTRAEEGHSLGQVTELIVKELLAWYLPWHEQVYLPWVQGEVAAREGGS
jgi:CheY-like chemotaxis protein